MVWKMHHGNIHTMIKKMGVIDAPENKVYWDFYFLRCKSLRSIFCNLGYRIDKDRAVHVKDKEGIESIYVSLCEELVTRRFSITNEKSEAIRTEI